MSEVWTSGTGLNPAYKLIAQSIFYIIYSQFYEKSKYSYSYFKTSVWSKTVDA